MSSKSHEMDLCSGSLWKKIFVYSVPLMFTNILQVLFNMSDVAVVGKFAGAIALGAVGSTSILVTLFTGILLGLASGVNALTALHIGSKDDEGVKRTVHTAVIICLAGGILITVFGILFSHNILALMNTKDELIDGAVLYLRIYLLGMPALGLYWCCWCCTCKYDFTVHLCIFNLAGAVDRKGKILSAFIRNSLRQKKSSRYFTNWNSFCFPVLTICLRQFVCAKQCQFL